MSADLTTSQRAAQQVEGMASNPGRLYVLLHNHPGIILSPVSFALLLGAWELVSRAGLVAPIVLPPPSRVWDGLVILLTAPWFPQHVWLTTEETLIGFAIGAVAAIVLGIAMVNMRLFKEVAYPYVVAFQVMPKVVLAPIFITWFGLGIESKDRHGHRDLFFSRRHQHHCWAGIG